MVATCCDRLMTLSLPTLCLIWGNCSGRKVLLGFSHFVLGEQAVALKESVLGMLKLRSRMNATACAEPGLLVREGSAGQDALLPCER